MVYIIVPIVPHSLVRRHLQPRGVQLVEVSTEQRPPGRGVEGGKLDLWPSTSLLHLNSLSCVGPFSPLTLVLHLYICKYCVNGEAVRVIGPTMIGEGAKVAGVLALMQHLLRFRILVWQDACV